MKNWFKQIETSESGTAYSLDEVLENLTFDSNGLLPVIVQDKASKDILMFAWMNRNALLETLNTGRMCYWSRSRQAMWRKGETSGHWQQVYSLRFDCDGDVMLAEVIQEGAACHTMRKSCFYLKVMDKQVIIDP